MASLILKTIDHLNVKLLIFLGKLQVLRFDFQKLRILEILNFHPSGSPLKFVQIMVQKIPTSGVTRDMASFQLIMIPLYMKLKQNPGERSKVPLVL